MKTLISVALVSFVVLLSVALLNRDDAPGSASELAAQPSVVPFVAPSVSKTASTTALPAAVSPAPLIDPSPSWQVISESGVPEDFRRPNIDDVAYLAIAGMAGLYEGDALDIVIPQEDVDYTAYVTEVTVSPSGNRSVSGIINNREMYRFVITVGQKRTFATLNTPGGRYQMEARNGIGRLIPAASIKTKLDYTKPDYIIPERFKPIEKG